MGDILNETVEYGFLIQEIRSWTVTCGQCGEWVDLDDIRVEDLPELGWFSTDDGQFCSKFCEFQYLALTGGVK